MKKRLLSVGLIQLAIAFLLITNNSSAQPLRLSNDTTTITGPANQQYIVADGIIYNDSNSPVNVRWIRIIEDVPAGWTTAVCDGNACYVQTVGASPVPFTIEPDSNATFDVYFYPDRITGDGTVQLIAWVEGDSANTVITGTFEGTAVTTVSIANTKSNSEIKTYPNPVNDKLQIKNLPVDATTIEVYSMSGKKILSSTLRTENYATPEYNLSHLATGTYIMCIYDSDGKIIFTETMNKK